MTMKLAVHHLAVLVRDLERAEAFYAGVLGLAVLRRWDDPSGKPRSVWVELGGGAFLAIEKAPSGAPARAEGTPGFLCVALGIQATERESLRRRLEAAGVPVERETEFTLYVRDPEENLIAFSHHPEAAPGGARAGGEQNS